MYQRFLKYMEESGMTSLLMEKGAVLAAYSGGADSTLLLHWLYRFCNERKIVLYAAHVHHGIRGEEADRDLEHCRKTADKLGIKLFISCVDVPQIAKERHMGIEECAREVRYAFFDAVTAELGIPDMLVATAHNADDQLETVLFHMMRGSGLEGMAGIASIREKRYIRPLLSFSGNEIRKICCDEQYPYVEDSTNADTAYTRNYIRHEILPKLRLLSPEPEKAITRMTALLARDNEYLEQTAAKRMGQEKNGSISREVLRSSHPAVASRMLRIAYEVFVSDRVLTADQTEKLLQMSVSTDRRTRYISLPGSVRAIVNADCVSFIPDTRQTSGKERICLSDREAVLPEYGKAVILEWKNDRIVLIRKKIPERPENLENIYNLSIQQPINFAKIKGVLRLRMRKAGDTICYGGMHRKVRKLQNQYRIPPAERDTAAILADEEEVLWMQGGDVCDKVRHTSGTTDILWIQYYSAEPLPTGFRSCEENDKYDKLEVDHAKKD